MAIVTAALLASGGAFAQQQQTNPAQEQIERTIGSLAVANANLAAQVAQAKTIIEDLQKQLAAEKAKNAPKPDEPPK